MSLKDKTSDFIISVTEKFNYFAALCLFGIMCVTCVDVFLRELRHPFPGAYELVGFLGSLAAAFAFASTSLGKGHIAVEYLVSKFSSKIRKRIERLNCFLSFIIFSIITWQIFIHAFELRQSGEVSMTLELPLFPFALGFAIGFGLVSIVMFFQAVGIVYYGFAKD